MENQKPKTGLMTVAEHLDEFRRRLLWSGAALAGFTLLGLALGRPLLIWLELPARSGVQHFILSRPTEIISLYFKIALYCGGLLTVPVVVYHSWQYFRPAAPAGLSRSIGWWVLAVFGLFVLGTIVTYTLFLPPALDLLFRLTREVATPLINLENYISFVLTFLLFGGAVFEMPLIIAFLTRLGVITPDLLRQRRREAWFALFVIAAVATPTVDPFNLLLFALPMLLLYELGIWTSVLIAKGRTDLIPEKEGDPYAKDRTASPR